MIGGMSWESTAEYYRLANELVKDRLGGLHSARLLLASVDFAEVERLQVTGQWEEAGRMLASIAKRLEAAGAELLLLCTNTMHKVADQVQAAVSIPFLHLADTTAVAITSAGLSTIGLLGTAFTMEQDFYRDRLARHGLRVLVPDTDDRAEVHRIVYEELCLGIVRESSRESYRAVIGRLVDAGAEGVVLGCTEIEMLIGASDSPVPLFPTTRLHVEAAVAAAFERVDLQSGGTTTGSVGHLRWPNEGTSSSRGAGHGAAGRLPGARRECAATTLLSLNDRAFVTHLTQPVAHLDAFANRASDAVGARGQCHTPDGRRCGCGGPEGRRFRSEPVVGHRTIR